MNKKKKTLIKQIGCLFFIFIFLFSSISFVFAESEYDNFYTTDQDALDEIFNLSLMGAADAITDPIGWLNEKNTFIAIREYTDENGELRYKIYVNCPNIQQYLYNMVLKSFRDGWDNNMYTPESKLVKEVGTNEDNVINKFGFNIPVNEYNGEYPKIYMSLAGILPTSFLQKVKTVLKALVGLSMVNAPEKSNLRTLKYFNHTYKDNSNEELVKFLQENWIPYFVRSESGGLWSDEEEYFIDAADFKYQMVTEDQKNKAQTWLDENEDDCKRIRKKQEEVEEWTEKYGSAEGMIKNCKEYENAVNDYISELRKLYELVEPTEKTDPITGEVTVEDNSEKYPNVKKLVEEYPNYLDLYSAVLEGAEEGTDLYNVLNNLEVDLPEYPNWEEYLQYVEDKPDNPTNDEYKKLVTQDEHNATIEKYEAFVKKFNNGYEKNKVAEKKKGWLKDNYKFSYAQCLLDMEEGEEDEEATNNCTKIYNGNSSISGSVTDVFVGSGAYKIGLTKESKEELKDWGSNSSSGGGTSPIGNESEIDISNCRKVAIGSVGAANCAQAMAYTNGYLAVSFVRTNNNPSYIKLFDRNGNSMGYTSANEISHGNSLASTHSNTILAGDGTGGGFFYEYDISSGTPKQIGSKSIPSGSVVAFDKDTKNYITGTKSGGNVYDINFNHKKNIDWSVPVGQDIGAGGGFIYRTHAAGSGNGKWNGGTIDIIDENTGNPAGKLKVDSGEIESVDIIEGEIVVLVHFKGPVNYLYFTGVKAGEGIKPPPPVLDYKDTLTKKEAIKLISLIQSKTGPAYEEVMTNIIACMIHNAESMGEEIEIEEDIDKRVMPYDISTLIASGGGSSDIEDGSNLTISDPRVEIYKKEAIGSVITGNNLYLAGLFDTTSITRKYINATGKISMLCVLLNRICTFEILEDMGLSPATMWKSFAPTVVMSLILTYLIFNIVIYSFRYVRGKAGKNEIFSRIAIFIMMLALVSMFTVSPDKTWNTVKRVTNGITGLGETIPLENLEGLEELYGSDSDSSVTYYIPYFNSWTKYNTGYTLTDPEQQINMEDPECEDIELTKIDGTETQLWSVVLADSFNKNGLNSNGLDGNGKNGERVNPNAYRAVDHFLAPRLYTTGPVKGGSLNLVNKENENYNGEFQKFHPITYCGIMLTQINLFFIVLIKVLIFYWFWYMLYLFLFNVVLASASKRNGAKDMVITTFSPILYLTLWGLYTSVIVQVSLIAEGIILVLLNLFFFAMTPILINYWSRNTRTFPKPLKLVLFITSPALAMMGISNRRRRHLEEDIKSKTGIYFDIVRNEDDQNAYMDEYGQLRREYSGIEAYETLFNNQVDEIRDKVYMRDTDDIPQNHPGIQMLIREFDRDINYDNNSYGNQEQTVEEQDNITTSDSSTADNSTQNESNIKTKALKQNKPKNIKPKKIKGGDK